MLYFSFLFIHTLYTIALQGTRPIVSLFAHEQGAAAFTIGLLVSLYAVTPMLLAIRVGKWLDRYGARRMVMFGGSGVFVALLLPAIFPGIHTLFFSQLFIGLCQVCILMSMQKTVGNLSGDRDKIIAGFSLTGSLGELIGPAVNGLAYDHFGFRSTYLLASAITFAALVLGFVLKRDSWKSGETNGQEPSGPSSSTWKMLRQKNLRNALIISGLVLYSKDIFVAYFPVYASKLGLSATSIGMILSLMATMSIVVRLLQFWLVKVFGREYVLLTTLIISGLAYIGVPFTALPVLLGCLAMLLGAGLGLGQPLSLVYVLNVSPADRQGEALGLRLTFNRASQFFAPLMFGTIGGIAGIVPVFIVSGAILLAGAYFTRTRPAKRGQSQEGFLTDVHRNEMK
ncbi:MFS transporter [Bacillaceae bacterium]